MADATMGHGTSEETEARKEVALAFLRAAANGHAASVKDTYTTPSARHHNPYFVAGMEALTDAMDDNAREHPAKQLDIQRVVADDEFVVVHSHVRQNPKELGAAVVHIFRFEEDKIAEMWDVGQAVPEGILNMDGMF